MKFNVGRVIWKSHTFIVTHLHCNLEIEVSANLSKPKMIVVSIVCVCFSSDRSLQAMDFKICCIIIIIGLKAPQIRSGCLVGPSVNGETFLFCFDEQVDQIFIFHL